MILTKRSPLPVGRLIKNAAVLYEGTLRGDVPHGRGVSYTVEGAPLYRGGWRDGARHGHGELFYQLEADSAVPPPPLYSGGWKDGLFHGHGVLYQRDGTALYSGKWEHGVFVGRRREGPAV